MQVIYLCITHRQTVNYYSAIHALELIYFDSNTNLTGKHIWSLACFPCAFKTVTLLFDIICFFALTILVMCVRM